MRSIVGIIPAGGLGKRMYPFKMWKELIPIGYREGNTLGIEYKIPNVVGEYVINNMKNADVEQIYMIINDQKQELFRFFGDGSQYQTHIAYLSQDISNQFYGMPVALDVAYPFIKNSTVLMGMPDTIIHPETAFKELIKTHRFYNADLTIGVFPTENPTQLAPVKIDGNNDVVEIYDKPKETSIYNTWNIAVWEPSFTEFIHREVEIHKIKKEEADGELLLSNLFMKAIDENLVVKGKVFKTGKCYDMGNIKDLYKVECEFYEKIGGDK